MTHRRAEVRRAWVASRLTQAVMLTAAAGSVRALPRSASEIAGTEKRPHIEASASSDESSPTESSPGAERPGNLSLRGGLGGGMGWVTSEGGGMRVQSTWFPAQVSMQVGLSELVGLVRGMATENGRLLSPLRCSWDTTCRSKVEGTSGWICAAECGAFGVGDRLSRYANTHDSCGR